MDNLNLLSHEEFINKYLDGQQDYYTVCIGTRNVDLEKIIASEELPAEVQDDEKMQRMRSSITENGWCEHENEDFSDIFLTLAPNGRYSINNGIRRFLIAKELGIESFRATIDVAVSSKYLDRSDLREIEQVQSQLEDLNNKIKSITNQYSGKSTLPKSAHNLINVYCNMYDRNRKKMDVIYQNIAIREGLIPRFYFENKEIKI